MSAVNKKIVVSFSGGLDSTIMLYNYLNLGWDVYALSIDYGQRHRKELDAAQGIVKHIADTQCGQLSSLKYRLLDMRGLRNIMAGSSLTSAGIPVPDGHYEEEAMKATVVPNRNMLLLSLGGAWAVSLKAAGIAIAAHGGDHAIYPDCRPQFMATMNMALMMCDWHEIQLFRPFLLPNVMSKADIVKLGDKLGVPMHATWSCYKGGAVHCGRCGTCVERREAFIHAGVIDATEYLDNGPLPEKKS